jgi:hypothetical protein
MFKKVFCLNSDSSPMMPVSLSRAKRLMKSGKAKSYFKKNIWGIKMLTFVSNVTLQPLILGIDTGSKRSGYTVGSDTDIMINIQTNAPDWINLKVEGGKMAVRLRMRRARRQRSTPYRKCRFARAMKKGRVPPSTKARWQAHLRIIKFLTSIFPISHIWMEEISFTTIANKKKIKATSTIGQDQRNINFSPLQCGKFFFERMLTSRYPMIKFKWSPSLNSKPNRDKRGFVKIKDKLSNSWEAHCVDSHTLVEMAFEDLLGREVPIEPNKALWRFEFRQSNYRKLHKEQHQQVPNGKRGKEGTNINIINGIKFVNGDLVRVKDTSKSVHKGIVGYIAGYKNDRITVMPADTASKKLLKLYDGDGRISVQPEDIEQLCRMSWTTTAILNANTLI